ncbi:MAG: oligopeptide ABC transporter permease [Longimicrobiaceae bacterium]
MPPTTTSPDTESSRPIPLPPAGAPEGGRVPSARAPASAGELATSALLPGAGHLLRGEWAPGFILFLSWGILLGTLFLTWSKVSEVFTARHTPVAGAVAVATAGALLLGLWGWALYDLKARAGRPRQRSGDSQWAIAARRFRKNRIALLGLGFMLLLYVVALITPLISPYDPNAQGDIVATRYLEPSLAHWMGTDKFGRDIFSRVLYGARISLTIGFVAMGIGVLLGTALGAVAGYFGKWVDSVAMRFTDMILSIPRLVLVIVVIALFEPSIWLVVTVLGLTGWMAVARIVRAEVLSLREREFVQAAKALGMTDARIILRHVLPNVLAPVIVYTTLGIGNTILIEAALSFLGLGVQPPTASWGNMISDGRDALITAWWIATFPGLAIVFTVTAFNLLGDGLRDALDPRLKI